MIEKWLATIIKMENESHFLFLNYLHFNNYSFDIYFIHIPHKDQLF